MTSARPGTLTAIGRFIQSGMLTAPAAAGALLALGVLSATAEPPEPAAAVRIEPRVSREQIILHDHPPGTRFDAAGLVLRGGVSERFSQGRRFTLLSDSSRDPAAGFGYEDTAILESWELPNAEIYPLQLRDLHSPAISGFTVIGAQSRDLPWRVLKAMWDGDALHIKGCTGAATITNVYWEYVEDGLGPDAGLDRWTLRSASMRDIRDDAVENDDLIPGEIVNCLIDGCFVFLSQRSDSPNLGAAPVTTIRDSVVHVQPQPHDGVADRQWRDANIRIGPDGIGRAPGMIFKWEPGAGIVSVKNCVFRMDAVSFNGPGDMAFPPGEYENVTLVWLGQGPYPAPVPRGVTLTRDVAVWETARAAWIARLSSSHPAAGVLRPAEGE